MKKPVIMQLLNIYRNTSPYLRTMCIYRYFSLLLTSTFYIMDKENYSLGYGALVIICLLVAALTLNYLYIKYKAEKRVIKLLTIFETISNVILLIPTGGLESPYIWYSLNTVLITAYFLNKRYFFFNLFSYTLFMAATSFYLLHDTNTNLAGFIYRNSNLILSYILIIYAIQLLLNLAKKVDERGNELSLVNRELVEANGMIEESMGYIALLFKSLQSFITIKEKGGFSNIIIEYTKNITNTTMAFLYTYVEHDTAILEIREDVSTGIREHLAYKLEQHWNSIVSSDEPMRLEVDGRELAVAAIKSSREAYGIIGIELKNRERGLIEKENINQIRFLAALVSIIIERFNIEEMNQLLMISDEQKRIADEIHDSVSQRLFYISCKVHSLIKAGSSKSAAEIKHELELVRDCLNSAMAELRDTIYNYSGKGKELSAFEENVRDYINEISLMNNVNISLNISGNQELICIDQKKAIYRITCEGIGNSIKHGKSENIKVDLYVEDEVIGLKISDDGVGFDLNRKIASNSMGLGIRNLYNLVGSSGGDISIESEPCKGTVIDVMLPNKLLMKAGQEGQVCV